MAKKTLLTPGQVTDLLQISERTVVRWLRDGYLRGYKLGKEWRIAFSDLDAFLERQANRPLDKEPLSISRRRRTGGVQVWAFKLARQSLSGAAHSFMRVLGAVIGWPRRSGARMAALGQKQTFGAMVPNDRFLICKRTFGETTANGCFWPIPATGAQASRITDFDPNRTFILASANVCFWIAKQTLASTKALCAARASSFS